MSSRESFSADWGVWVKTRRQQMGLTQVAFAGHLGISPAYMSNIERGFVPPSTTIKRMAEHAGDDPAEWLEAANIPQDMGILVTPVPESGGIAAAMVAVRHPIGMILSDGRVVYHTEIGAQMRYHAVKVVSEGLRGVFSGDDLVIVDSQAEVRPELTILIQRGGRHEVCRCVEVEGGDDGGVTVAALPAKARATTRNIPRADVIGVAVYAVRPLT